MTAEKRWWSRINTTSELQLANEFFYFLRIYFTAVSRSAKKGFVFLSIDSLASFGG